MDLAFRRVVAEARRQGDLYFASLLPEDRILEAFGKARWLWRGWVYTPAVTVWVFLAQCLSADHSCRDAVAGLIAGTNDIAAETGIKPGPVRQGLELSLQMIVLAASACA